MQDEVPHVALDAVEADAPPGRTAWIGTAIGLAALVTSIVSIWLAVKNAGAMNQLVQANSWPHLQILTSNSADGARELRFTVENSGAGPAKLHSLIVLVDGKPVRNASRLFEACCIEDGETPGTFPTGSFSPTDKVLNSGTEIIFFRSAYGDDYAEWWTRLDRARWNKITFQGCYCSVFDECWTTDFQSLAKQSVDQCEVAPESWQG